MVRGAAAVWTTCLVFFQTSLLAGYAYSDFVARKLALPTLRGERGGEAVQTRRDWPLSTDDFNNPVQVLK